MQAEGCFEVGKGMKDGWDRWRDTDEEGMKSGVGWMGGQGLEMLQRMGVRNALPWLVGWIYSLSL